MVFLNSRQVLAKYKKQSEQIARILLSKKNSVRYFALAEMFSGLKKRYFENKTDKTFLGHLKQIQSFFVGGLRKNMKQPEKDAKLEEERCEENLALTFAFQDMYLDLILPLEERNYENAKVEPLERLIELFTSLGKKYEGCGN